MNSRKHIIDKALDLSTLNVSFTAKPVIIGGLAMEYYDFFFRSHL